MQAKTIYMYTGLWLVATHRQRVCDPVGVALWVARVVVNPSAPISGEHVGLMTWWL